MFVVPVVFIVAVAVTLAFYFYFRYRARAEVQTTVRKALEHGQQLTPDFLERLSASETLGAGRHGDFRRGVISLAIAAGIAGIGLIAGKDEDFTRPMLAIAVLPAVIGLAYVALWRFLPRE